MKTEPSTSSTTPPVLPKRGEPEINPPPFLRGNLAWGVHWPWHRRWFSDIKHFWWFLISGNFCPISETHIVRISDIRKQTETSDINYNFCYQKNVTIFWYQKSVQLSIKILEVNNTPGKHCTDSSHRFYYISLEKYQTKTLHKCILHFK